MNINEARDALRFFVYDACEEVKKTKGLGSSSDPQFTSHVRIESATTCVISMALVIGKHFDTTRKVIEAEEYSVNVFLIDIGHIIYIDTAAGMPNMVESYIADPQFQLTLVKRVTDLYDVYLEHVEEK